MAQWQGVWLRIKRFWVRPPAGSSIMKIFKLSIFFFFFLARTFPPFSSSFKLWRWLTNPKAWHMEQHSNRFYRLNHQTKMAVWPNGKAFDYELKDSGFDPQHGHLGRYPHKSYFFSISFRFFWAVLLSPFSNFERWFRSLTSTEMEQMRPLD